MTAIPSGPVSADAALAPTRAWLLRLALGGLVISIGLRFLPGLQDQAVLRILALGVLTVVPLTLAIAPPAGATFAAFLRIAAIGHPFAAALAIGSMFREPGPAGPWVSLWVGFAVLLATGAFFHFFGAARKNLVTLGVGAAFVYVLIGAAWFLAHRARMRPLRFDGLTVLLTAVHFHFAAVAPPMLAARAARLTEGVARRAAGLSIVGIVLAQPIIALGITSNLALGLGGTVLLAVSLWVLAAVELGAVWRRFRTRTGRLLLTISALSAFLSMPLAVLYAYGQLMGEGGPGLELMIRAHGYANAHGLAVCGLFAWAVEDRHGALREPAPPKTTRLVARSVSRAEEEE